MPTVNIYLSVEDRAIASDLKARGLSISAICSKAINKAHSEVIQKAVKKAVANAK